MNIVNGMCKFTIEYPHNNIVMLYDTVQTDKNEVMAVYTSENAFLPPQVILQCSTNYRPDKDPKFWNAYPLHFPSR